jgi:hypothetical protein
MIEVIAVKPLQNSGLKKIYRLMALGSLGAALLMVGIIVADIR